MTKKHLISGVFPESEISLLRSICGLNIVQNGMYVWTPTTER